MPHPVRIRPIAAAACLAAIAAAPAWATNGMDMEGYGPIAAGMGGVSQAIDHGTAAVIENPATLSLMKAPARLDVALGVLGPRITSSVPGTGMSARSDGTAYVMPALGYARKDGPWTYGLGIFAQGGMGTEYGADAFLALGSGQGVRSELGFGRLILPLAYEVSPALSIGGTLDLVWGGLDLKMAASGAQLGGLVTGASGGLGASLPALAGAPWARIDFSNGNDFTGSANATGWGAKIGVVYRPTPELTVGASHHFKTSLGDMKTGARSARMSADGGFRDEGRMTVVDFQWPATTALGVAWQATPRWLIAADVKRIRWSGVMQQFRMRYDSATLGGSVSFALPQFWRDQTVVQLGVAYAVSDALTLRAGFNRASNPVPDAYLNPLFPATVERHYTFGLGYAVSPAGEINASVSIAPTVRNLAGSGVLVSHRQTNLQVMYTHRF